MHVLSTAKRAHWRPWLVPMMYALGALAAEAVLPRLENFFFPHLKAELSIDSALALYSSIASGMMALTGIVFSLTFLMVQFSATAYSPRLVLWIARDPVLSHALGIFTATFLYAIAALSWLDRGNSRKVLLINALTVVSLLLASVGMFIALIQRIGHLQINRMLLFTGNQGRQVIENLYEVLTPFSVVTQPGHFARPRPAQTMLHEGRPLYLQAVNVKRLVQLAKRHDGRIDVVTAVGDTALEGTPLLHVAGARYPIPETELRKTLELGEERTFEQDPKYAIRLLVDIAIRALSPAINDPTTAVQALDQIGDLLLRLARRRLEAGYARDRDGRLRLVYPMPTWEDYLTLAFDEIRQFGASSVQVMRRLRSTLV